MHICEENKLWINGTTGQIGRELCRYLSQKLSIKIEQITSQKGVDKTFYLDLSATPPHIIDKIRKGDYLIFLASLCNFKQCTLYQDLAYKINVLGTSSFLDFLIERGVKVIYFSSAAVYGNSDSPCKENSGLLGNSIYAQHKKEIEQRYKKEPLIRILRPSTIIAPGDNFVTYLIKCFQRGEIAEIYKGVKCNPIGLSSVVEIILEIFKHWEECPSILNIGGPEVAGKEDIAREYQECHNKSLRYVAIDPPSSYDAGRENKINLDITTLNRFMKRSLPSLHQIVMTEYRTFQTTTSTL